jgi:hypothetical protein
MVEPVPMPSGLVLFGISLGVISAFVLFLWAVNYLKGWRPRDMSSREETHAPESRPALVHVPVPSISTDPPPAKVVPADTDAANADTDPWAMPPASRHLSNEQIIIFLAAQKLPNGKWRFSANDIYELVKGPRADVLKMIRELREPPVIFYDELKARIQAEA